MMNFKHGITLLGLSIFLTTASACAGRTGSDNDSINLHQEDSCAIGTIAQTGEDQQADKTPRKVSILGDSYSTFEGWVPEENIAWYKPVPKEGRPTDVTKVDQTWWKIFIDRNGEVLEKNNSYSGATICNTGYGNNDYSDRSFVTRLTDIGNPDLIFVFGGTNDSFADSPHGDYVWDSWTPDQLYYYRPATAYMISELQRLHPEADILFIISDDMKPDYMESSITVMDHYGVPYVILEDIEKMSIHPDQKGMLQLVDQVEQSLTSNGIKF